MFRELKKAFSVSPSAVPPKDEQLKLVDQLAEEIVRRRMTAPALAMLEMSRPLNFLGAQAMHFFSPILSSMFDTERYNEFARFLERRDALQVISERIERQEKLVADQAADTGRPEESNPS